MKKMFKSKKTVLISIIAIAIALFIFINICASAFFSFALFKKDGWNGFEKYLYGDQLKSDSEWLSGRSEKVKIENSEGKTLTALNIKNENVSDSFVIICHQYGGSPESMECYAKHFYDLGFNILLPYMRGHGESSYNNISFGWGDRFDIKDWVEFITEKHPESKIMLFGVSLGANAVTLCATEDLPDNVRLVISDSCYTSMNELMKEYIKNETPFSALLTANLTSAFAKNKFGESFKDADIIEKLRGVEIPIMFINAENDSAVPSLVSKKLYENCEAEGVEEVLIEKGTHGNNLQTDAESYWSNVDGFILNNIGI